ncbi:MAG TPA: DUF996 domain-containing protein [Nitrososphaerales archaeon]|nr:DUF996 domain-containing protein [Nitrososphaerales archaeon]
MTSLSDAKVLGGVGSILVLLSAVPTVGALFGIAGFIMILVAINNISRVVSEKSIYSNMLIAVVLAIGAVVVGAVTVVGAVFHVLSLGSFVGSRFVLPSNIAPSSWFGLAVAVFAGVLVVWALLVSSAVFIRRSYNSIAGKLNVHMFETAGLLYLIGAATAIIVIGFPILLIAQILLAVAFFSIAEQSQVIPAARQQTVASTS